MSTNVQTNRRLEFVDAHRGLAVVLMLWMHSADGWLRPELKQGAAWGWVRSLGGLAAPTFLFLAGVSVSLAWGLPSSDLPGQRRVELARGLQLVVLGYALRLQMWMLDAGGVRHVGSWAAAVPLAFAYWAAYRALAAWARSDHPIARRLAYASLAAVTAGVLVVSTEIHDRLLPLLRVDVLQAIGASLALIAAARRPLRERPWLGAVLGLVAAWLTPWFRAWVPGPLPVPIAGYLAAWDVPAGQLAPTLFPLFPWLAYALIGTSVGHYLGSAERARSGGASAALRLAGLGLALALATNEALRPGHSLIAAWPIATQPVRVAYRVGAALLLGGLAVGLGHHRMPTRRPLLTIGRASLFVYWVHLELAFGTLSRPLAHRLDYRGWSLGLAAIVVAMTGLAALWSLLRPRSSRAGPRQTPAGAGGPEPAQIGSA